MTLRLASVATALAALPLAAHAHPSAPDSPTIEPLEMDRYDPHTRYAVQLDSTIFTESEPDTLYGERLELFGQYVTPSLLGFYGAVQVSKVFGFDEGLLGEEPGLGIGNLELGAFVVATAPSHDLMFHFGVELPTASDDDGAISNLFGAFGRINDLSRAIPAWFLRPSITFTTRGPIFFRADVGIDIGIAKDEDLVGERDKTAIARLNAGFGIVGDTAVFLGEVVTLFNAEEFEDSDVLFQPMVGVRLRSGLFHPGIAIGSLIADDIDLGDTITLSLSATSQL